MKGILSLAALALLVPTPAPAEGTEPPPFVATDLTIEGGEHVWTGPVVIGPGATLTVRDATVWLDWEPPVCTRGTAGYCQPTIMVLPGGTLETDGSTFDAHAWQIDEPYGGYTIHAAGGALELHDSTFRHFEAIGAQGGGPAPSSITGNTFAWGISGISLIRTSTGEIVGNRFEDVMYAIAVRDTSAIVRNNHIVRAQRLFASEPFGRGIEVQYSLAGEKAMTTLPIVEGNVIEDGAQGILNLNGFPNIVRGNTIRNNRIGASIGLTAGETSFNHAAPSWTGNRFEGNLEALQVYVSGRPETGEAFPHLALRGNSFLGTTCSDVITMPTAPTVHLSVDASGNWWGSPDGPQDRGPGCPALSGNVTAEDWLTEAP